MEKSLEGNLEQKWWFRIAKVGYISLNVAFVGAVVVGFIDNFYSYDIYLETNIYKPGDAFLNLLISLILGIAIIRIIKITFFYIFLAHKPDWKKELKQLV